MVIAENIGADDPVHRWVTGDELRRMRLIEQSGEKSEKLSITPCKRFAQR